MGPLSALLDLTHLCFTRTLCPYLLIVGGIAQFEFSRHNAADMEKFPGQVVLRA